jgi:DNA-binding NarL/FixJ family response regulator
VLSSAEDPYTVRAALTAGVRAFLVSPAAATALRAAPAERSGGQLPVQRPRPVRTAGPEGLSGREIEVLQLVADGQSNKGIGGALGLSALTVKSHLARIARKLGTGDRAEMVVVAMRAGVVV